VEILLCYSGLHALIAHRIAHRLWRWGVPFLPRFISHLTRLFTNIEIHPGARIRPGFFIDHGAGVVIGETTEISENVTVYQGVTLGGTGKERGKRHPTIGSHVVIGAGAIILGPVLIGDHAKIGAGAVVLKPVPPHSTAVGVPARVVMQAGARVPLQEDEPDLDHSKLPDPEEDLLQAFEQRIRQLETRVQELEAERANGAMSQWGNESMDQ
jgi:serine O-acetyltransferase